MQSLTLIADSGSTKAEWCLLQSSGKKTTFTQGISPYFLDKIGIVEVLRDELAPKLNNSTIGQVHYYGTGCANPENAKIVKKALKEVFAEAEVEVQTDLMGAARASCATRRLNRSLCHNAQRCSATPSKATGRLLPPTMGANATLIGSGS